MKTVNILLVEDNAGDVELVREALDEAKLPHILLIATDFDEAKEYLDGSPDGFPRPDVLLMDLNLPQGSGLELLRMIRERPEWQPIPVIVVSSSNAERDREQAVRFGAVHYFRKPSDLNEFMKLGPIVRKWLQSRAAESAPV